MNFINWGLIGFGNVVKNNLNGLPFNTENSKIYAFHQRNFNEAIKNKEKYNIDKFYSNVLDLLSDKNVNVVYICTPPGSHLEYAKLCCDYNKPAYIEKPFARNYIEVCQIIEYFKTKNVPLWVAHYKRTLPKFVQVKNIIDSNAIGKIINITYTCERPFNVSLLNHKWLYNLELSGGGRFFDIAPHFIDLLVFFFGKFELVYSIVSNHCSYHNTEDIVSFNFKTLSNVIGTANFNFISNRRFDLMTIYGTEGNLTFSIEGGGNLTMVAKNETKTYSFSEPLIYEKNMVNAINAELLDNDFNNSICHGSDAIEVYRIIDLILDNFYNGRNRDFWKNQ